MYFFITIPNLNQDYFRKNVLFKRPQNSDSASHKLAVSNRAMSFVSPYDTLEGGWTGRGGDPTCRHTLQKAKGQTLEASGITGSKKQRRVVARESRSLRPSRRNQYLAQGYQSLP